jgi:hypothetical protein
MATLHAPFSIILRSGKVQREGFASTLRPFKQPVQAAEGASARGSFLILKRETAQSPEETAPLRRLVVETSQLCAA